MDKLWQIIIGVLRFLTSFFDRRNQRDRMENEARKLEAKLKDGVNDVPVVDVDSASYAKDPMGYSAWNNRGGVGS